MKTYIVFSVFDGSIRHLQICQSQDDAEKALYTAATNNIIDRIGKNNYVDTINNDVPAKLCPAGYVIKYARGNEVASTDIDVPKKSSEFINQIYIMKTYDVETGRIFSHKVRKIDIEGYYAVSEVNSVDTIAVSSTISAPRHLSRSANGGIRVKYDAVINEILSRSKSTESVVLKSDLVVKEEPAN